MIAGLVIAWIVSRLGFVAMELIGANIYDIRLLTRRKRNPRYRRYKSARGPQTAVRIRSYPSLLNLLLMSGLLFQHRNRKFQDILGGSKYASDTVVYVQAEPTYMQALKSYFVMLSNNFDATLKGIYKLIRHKSVGVRLRGWLSFVFGVWKLVVLLIEPAVLTYIIYLAAIRQTTALLVITAISIAVTLVFFIWSDEHLKPADRLRLTFFVPVLCLAGYLISFVRTVLLVACLLTSKAGRTGGSTRLPLKLQKITA